MSYTEYLTVIQDACAHVLGMYLYQDYIEVAVFIGITYQTLLWLKQDHTKHLLFASYAYFGLLSTSYLLSCTILFSTMLLLTPALMILAIVIHQKQLQKNFVLASSKVSSPKTVPHKNWVETLIQSALIASHQQKQITCIIERTDHLRTLLHMPFVLELPIQKDITNLLLASSNITPHTMLWAQQSGMIHSINVSWSSFLTNELLLTHNANQDIIHHEAATLLTQKTDALIFEINMTKDTHTIWYQGKCMQHITVKQLLTFVKEVLHYSKDKKTYIKGNNHDQANRPTS